jgi:hypothetical protein
MNVIVWWFVLMIPTWALAAYILWGTSVVVSKEDEEVEDE